MVRFDEEELTDREVKLLKEIRRVKGLMLKRRKYQDGKPPGSKYTMNYCDTCDTKYKLYSSKLYDYPRLCARCRKIKRKFRSWR